MNFREITYQKIKDEINYYLRETYNKADLIFSPAEPFGQVVDVIQGIYSTLLQYTKNVVDQFDVNGKAKNNVKMMRTLAKIGGYNPTRPISSTGVLTFKLKPGINISEEINGNQITIFDKTQLKNKTNNLYYVLDLGADNSIFQLDNNRQFHINLIQGKYEKQTLTGSGSINQSYVINIPGSAEIENFNFTLKINGELWTIRKHIWDMLPEEKAVVVDTGFSNGVELKFGNNSYGKVPPIGSLIEFEYLLTDGSIGNINRKTFNDFSFMDDILDSAGESVDIEELFDISNINDINFGADGDSVEFLSNILPIVSTNFVLGQPQQFAFQIKKLGVFSKVSAYTLNDSNEDDTIYVYAVPDIRLFREGTTNYFNINQGAFYLDEDEKEKLYEYLKGPGTMLVTKGLKIVNPKLKKYIINIFVQLYDNVIEETLKIDIQNKISDYFLNSIRFDRIPTSDVISLIQSINEVDSVEVVFLSEENETYHLRNNIFEKNVNTSRLNVSKYKPLENYNSEMNMGLDNTLGDIIFKNDEYPIIRGGWIDRNGIEYEENLSNSGPGPINIFVKGYTRKDNLI